MSRSRLAVPLSPYRHEHQLHYARLMRRSPTPSEALLWSAVRGDRLGFRVRRQVVVGPYIADFLVKPARLVIEIDGSAHIGLEHNDAFRDRELEVLGYRVLRVTASQVMRDVHAVVRRLVLAVG